MSTQPAQRSAALTPFEQLRYARDIIQIEAHALLSLAKSLGAEFCQAIDLLYHCRGSVIVTGMGKAGTIGQKITATLASTGTRSHFLHPADAVHGDLGRVDADDIVLVLSQSGETEEVVRLLPSLEEIGVVIIALTSGRTSTLARRAGVVLDLGPIEEACPLGLAPSTSTTAMLALGDALALVTSRLRDFRREDFARVHPAGALGRQLSKVEEHMRPLDQCRLALDRQTVRNIFVERGAAGRRTGAVMLTNDAGLLVGIFTDSDLARLFENRRDSAVDGPISAVMTAEPCTVPLGSMMVDAVAIMAERKISELPVIDSNGRPVGLIDITDVVGMFPEVQATRVADLDRSATLPIGPPPPKHTLFFTPQAHDDS